MQRRLSVFIDYQNTYMSARRVFFDPQSAPHFYGQFWPHLLGQYLASDSPPGETRILSKVHVYRGLPDASKDARGYSAARSQIAAWEKHGKGITEVHTRPLRYPRGWPDDSEPGDKPGEKGVDVELAIDMAMQAVRGEFDVGILVSLDTDLRPPLEAIWNMKGDYPRPEVAAWSSPEQQCRRLSVKGLNLFCHWMDRETFNGIADNQSYPVAM